MSDLSAKMCLFPFDVWLIRGCYRDIVIEWARIINLINKKKLKDYIENKKGCVIN